MSAPSHSPPPPSSPTPTLTNPRDDIFTTLSALNTSISDLYASLTTIRDEFFVLLSSNHATPDLITKNRSILHSIIIQCGEIRYRVCRITVDLKEIVEKQGKVSNVPWVPKMYWDESLREKLKGVDQRAQFLRNCIEEMKIAWVNIEVELGLKGAGWK